MPPYRRTKSVQMVFSVHSPYSDTEVSSYGTRDEPSGTRLHSSAPIAPTVQRLHFSTGGSFSGSRDDPTTTPPTPALQLETAANAARTTIEGQASTSTAMAQPLAITSGSAAYLTTPSDSEEPLLSIRCRNLNVVHCCTFPYLQTLGFPRYYVSEYKNVVLVINIMAKRIYILATLYGPSSSLYRIEASSDGLILGGCTIANSTSWWREMFVCNPLTHQSVKLPTLYLSMCRWVCGLTTRVPQPVGKNQDSVTYKVVRIQFTSTPDSVKFDTVDIFSSDTGRWTRKERVSYHASVKLDSCQPLLNYKGILYYFDWSKETLVTYDPYDSPERFGSIPLPVRSGKKVLNSGVNLIRLGLQELIEFGEIEDRGDGDWRLCVWRLVDFDKGEWCMQKRCPISSHWNASLFRDCRLLFAPDPLNADFFWSLYAYEDAHDLASAEKVCVDLFKVKNRSFDLTLAVPILLNPWSSPFHGEAGCNSSSTTGFRKIIPAWFPSYAK